MQSAASGIWGSSRLFARHEKTLPSPDLVLPPETTSMETPSTPYDYWPPLVWFFPPCAKTYHRRFWFWAAAVFVTTFFFVCNYWNLPGAVCCSSEISLFVLLWQINASPPPGSNHFRGSAIIFYLQSLGQETSSEEAEKHHRKITYLWKTHSMLLNVNNRWNKDNRNNEKKLISPPIQFHLLLLPL